MLDAKGLFPAFAHLKMAEIGIDGIGAKLGPVDQTAQRVMGDLQPLFRTGAFSGSPGSFGNFLHKADIARSPDPGRCRGGDECPQWGVVALAQGRDNQRFDAKARKIGPFAILKAVRLKDVVDHHCVIMRDLHGIRKIGQAHFGGQGGQPVVVHPLGNIGGVILQAKNMDGMANSDNGFRKTPIPFTRHDAAVLVQDRPHGFDRGVKAALSGCEGRFR